MGLLKRGELQHPVLQQETVEVPELGGEVVVRGLRLSERLSITAAGDDFERFGNVSRVLAWCVLDAEGEPLMSREEWEAFGASHVDSCIRLFGIARRLSLLDQATVEKKSQTTPS